MQTHIQKWGNSLGVRIPAQVVKKLHLHSGSLVILEIEDGKLVLQVPQYDLDTMVAAITPKNQHHLMMDDQQTGSEEW